MNRIAFHSQQKGMNRSFVGQLIRSENALPGAAKEALAQA
jgi:hypothetical protein